MLLIFNMLIRGIIIPQVIPLFFLYLQEFPLTIFFQNRLLYKKPLKFAFQRFYCKRALAYSAAFFFAGALLLAVFFSALAFGAFLAGFSAFTLG